MKRALLGLTISALCFGLFGGCSGNYQKSNIKNEGELSDSWHVESVNLEVNGKTVEVSGRLKNISGYPLGYIDMLADLMDASGNIIATGETHILFEVALEDKEQTGYKITVKNVKQPNLIEKVSIRFDD